MIKAFLDAKVICAIALYINTEPVAYGIHHTTQGIQKHL
jgi:hypothetical protein